jgi:hypothetical protein
VEALLAIRWEEGEPNRKFGGGWELRDGRGDVGVGEDWHRGWRVCVEGDRGGLERVWSDAGGDWDAVLHCRLVVVAGIQGPGRRGERRERLEGDRVCWRSDILASGIVGRVKREVTSVEVGGCAGLVASLAMYRAIEGGR